MLQGLEKIEQRILQHEDLFQISYIDNLVLWFNRNQLTPQVVGGHPVMNGEIGARVDDGRWVVDCPNADPETGASRCNSAAATSKIYDAFICGECGSPENDCRWYQVRYPEDREEIERLLCLRAGRSARFFSPFDVIHQPGADVLYRLQPAQTVDDLRVENEELGFGI